jgi:hypothetical protein
VSRSPRRRFADAADPATTVSPRNPNLETMSETPETTGEPSLMDELLEEELSSDERVELAFEDVNVDVPLAFGDDAPAAEWRVDGTVRIETEGEAGALREWLQLWRERRD